MHSPLRAVKELFRNLFRKHATEQYPFSKAKLKEKFRGRILFKPENCIGCQLCVRNCPADAIKIVHINPEDKPKMVDGKPVPAKRKFKCVIDLSKCIYCGQCVDSCMKSALSLSQDFELAQFDKSKLIDETNHPDENNKSQETKDEPKEQVKDEKNSDEK